MEKCGLTLTSPILFPAFFFVFFQFLVFLVFASLLCYFILIWKKQVVEDIVDCSDGDKEKDKEKDNEKKDNCTEDKSKSRERKR